MRVEEIQVLVSDVVLPPPDITVSQWADDNRRLSSESAAERGEWRTDRAPYQRAIMDALTPSHPCERSIRYCLLDEVDRYPASAGTEGDPVNLAIVRTANFWNRKIVLRSTPTVKGAPRVEAAWLESNQRMYWITCPHCGAHQALRRDIVEWPEGDSEKAQGRFEHCGQMIGSARRS